MLVSFDCYGTLVDWKKSIGDFLHYHFGGNEIVRSFFNCEYSTIGKGYRRYKEILAECLRVASGVKDSRLEMALILSFAKSPPFPDVYYGLLLLKERGYKLAIISNTDKDLIKITLAGFEEIFDYIITAEDTKYYKPNPLAFKTAYELMKVKHEEVVHVSAYPEYDLEAVSSLGIKNVMIDRYGYNWKPKVKDMVELARFIEYIR
ncbi:MAG: HAD-IA family hydrolase [Sulfolobaceae archaeon]